MLGTAKGRVLWLNARSIELQHHRGEAVRLNVRIVSMVLIIYFSSDKEKINREKDATSIIRPDIL